MSAIPRKTNLSVSFDLIARALAICQNVLTKVRLNPTFLLQLLTPCCFVKYLLKYQQVYCHLPLSASHSDANVVSELALSSLLIKSFFHLAQFVEGLPLLPNLFEISSNFRITPLAKVLKQLVSHGCKPGGCCICC